MVQPVDWGMLSTIGDNVASGLVSLGDSMGITKTGRARARNDAIFRGLGGSVQQPAASGPGLGALAQGAVPGDGGRPATPPMPAPAAPATPAPGNVAQMQGAQVAPSAAPADMGAGIDTQLLVDVMRDPSSTEEDRGLATMLLKQRMAANDPANKLDMDYKRAQIEALQQKGDGPVKQWEMSGGTMYNPYTGETRQAPGGADNRTQQEILTREAEARRLGLDVNSEIGRAYVLTGQMPKGEQRNLTAGDRQAVREADLQVQTATSALSMLDKALELNEKAYDGMGAGWRGWWGSNVGDPAGQATVDLDNIIQNNALMQMKAIFGGNPTEGERAILMEIAGASSLPAKNREAIYKRAKDLINSRLGFYRDQANELRGGTYYEPKGEGGRPGPNADGWTDVGGGVRIRPKGQ